MNLNAFQKFFMSILVTFFVAAPYADAGCLAWLSDRLTPPQNKLTSNFDEVQRIDIGSINQSDLEKVLGKPVAYQNDPGSPWKIVGPILFYRAQAFARSRRRVIQEVVDGSRRPDWLMEAKKRRCESVTGDEVPFMPQYRRIDHRCLDEDFNEGIEVGKMIVTLKSGRMIRSPLRTSFSADYIDPSDLSTDDDVFANLGPHDFAKIEIYHYHPGTALMAAAISYDDVKTVTDMAQIFFEHNAFPEIHIFAISDSSFGRLVSHYSTQL